MPDAELTINVTEFEARSLALLDDLARGTLSKITVTRLGKPLAIVAPAERERSHFDEMYRSMAGTMTIAPGVDLTAPTVDDDWEEEMLKSWDEQNR